MDLVLHSREWISNLQSDSVYEWQLSFANLANNYVTKEPLALAMIAYTVSLNEQNVINSLQRKLNCSSF